MCQGSDGHEIENLREELEAARDQINILQERIRELEKLSITDELTGLYNQRHFHDKLGQEVARNRRQRHPLCILFFDVDGLKTYNDTYGHSGGNEVLKAVARSLLLSIRKEVDTGYRYGGDEFAVILPEVDAEQALGIAKRINRHLQEEGFEQVSLSFGIAELRPEMDSETLFRHADQAMYVAKKGHESKICIYSAEEKTADAGGDE